MVDVGVAGVGGGDDDVDGGEESVGGDVLVLGFCFGVLVVWAANKRCFCCESCSLMDGL